MGEFVRKSWAGTRRGHLGQRPECECSGKDWRGEEDSREWEEEEGRAGDRGKELEKERWVGRVEDSTGSVSGVGEKGWGGGPVNRRHKERGDGIRDK